MKSGKLTIISPIEITRENNILQELSIFGINHLTPSPDLGWCYVLDHVWLYREIQRYIKMNTGITPVILDVGCGQSHFRDFLRESLGVNIIGIDRSEGYCHQENLASVDVVGDFLTIDQFPERSTDIVYWLSSIEHNKENTIRQLYMKSMRMLKEGGLFLATIPISRKTEWFKASEQTNLTVQDALSLFNLSEAEGTYQEITEQYRRNILFLRDKYSSRYGTFGSTDPQFIIGGIHKEQYLENDLKKAIKILSNKLVLFAPSNDTHTNWMYSLARQIPHRKFMVSESIGENADVFLEKLDEGFEYYYRGILETISPDAVILGNDWGNIERQIISEARELKIPTICIQEGPLDFTDLNLRRLQNADHVFLHGPIMKFYLTKRNGIFVTGNPKYDNLYEVDIPPRPRVMINCNFTYGIFEDIRNQWVTDIVDVCKELQVDFFVSKHPRDTGEFPQDFNVIGSDAYRIKDQITSASILISRFSTVIYEAMMMGREVIYYNPHKEPFRIFSEDTTQGIWIANNKEELHQSLMDAIRAQGQPRPEKADFLANHCATLNHDATDNCLKALSDVIDSEKQTKLVDKLNPVVSIIVPTFNRPFFLENAIKSILSQTFDNYEVIVINDAGEDVHSLIEKYNSTNKIKYISHDVNKGLASARNSGIKIARGKYIAYLDDDDIFYPDHLSTLVEYLESNPDYQVAYTDAEISYQEKVGNIYIEKKREIRYSFDFDPDRILYENFIPVLCIMHRNDCLNEVGLFDPILMRWEDWDLWIRLSRKFRFAHIKGSTCEVSLRTDGSSMVSSGKTEIWSFAALNLLYKMQMYAEGKSLVKTKIHNEIEYHLKNIHGYLLKGLYSYNYDAYKALGYEDIEILTRRINFLCRQYGQEYRHKFYEILVILLAFRSHDSTVYSQIISWAEEKEQALKTLSFRVTQIGDQLVKKEQDVQALRAQLSEIYRSRAWKMALIFRRIRLAFAPPNSRRARLLRQLMNLSIFPFIKIRRNLIIKGNIALIKSSDLFDEDWYLSNNPNVAQAKMDPILHYLCYGGFEGRDPGPNFQSAWYLATYEDVKTAGLNPLVHYITYGRGEGRAPHPGQTLAHQE
jgi:glycosyltransferase involved in cell wall biosynthesis